MELKAHLSISESPIGNLIIVHENRGLDNHIRDVANRFAKNGFAVAAPDYLSLVGGTVSDTETNIANIKEISREEVVRVTDYWLDVLSSLSKIEDSSILGFCWGGGAVNHCVTQLQSIDKAIMFYGVAPDLSQVENIKAKMQLHYAENDDRINSGTEDFHNALQKHRIIFHAHVYEGAEHAFFNNTRVDRYHKKSADIAFKRVIEFLND